MIKFRLITKISNKINQSVKCYGKTSVLSILSARVCLDGESGKKIDIHAQGVLKVFEIESESSAEFDFCGVEFLFYPDGKWFVGFWAIFSPSDHGGIYLVVVTAFFSSRQRRLAPGKVRRPKSISIYNFIHQSLPVSVKSAGSLL